MRTIKKFLVGLAILVVVLCISIVGTLYNFAFSPSNIPSNLSVLEIPNGTTLRQVSHQLESKKIISSEKQFMMFTYFQGKQDHIQAGEYQLSGQMTPYEILDIISNGRTHLHTVTIPEGHRIAEIASILEKEGLVNSKKFISETQNSELIKSLKISAESLEGYLFPETYRFSKNTGERKIIEKMVDTFKEKVLNPSTKEMIKESGLTFHEVITLASLIEKETGLDSERKIISSVFHNRLEKRMRLQTDPTVIYAMAHFDGNIRKKDLSIDSPYNTYKHFGLPPGPIANPGLASIHAAIQPAQTNHLYFVSRQDGSHQFSNNLKDHNFAVRKYQLHRKQG